MFEAKPIIKELLPIPLFVDGERDAGWVIIYQYPDGTLKDGNNVFDTKKEATKVFKLGGEYEGEFGYMMNKMLQSIGLGYKIVVH